MRHIGWRCLEKCPGKIGQIGVNAELPHSPNLQHVGASENGVCKHIMAKIIEHLWTWWCHHGCLESPVWMCSKENRSTHSSHPYIDMIFYYKASSYCGIPIVGNPQILAQQNPSTSFSYINLILPIIFHQCLILKKHKFSCTTNSRLPICII